MIYLYALSVAFFVAVLVLIGRYVFKRLDDRNAERDIAQRYKQEEARQSR